MFHVKQFGPIDGFANALLRGATRSESGNWRKQKIATPAGQPPSGEPEVEIEFPFGTKEKACDGDKYVVPARRARTRRRLRSRGRDGARSRPVGACRAYILTGRCPGAASRCAARGGNRPRPYIFGISQALQRRGRNHRPTTDPDGLRQFRGVQSQVYWFEKGSSGSPVFLQNGEQLAGIIALSELGANEGEGHLREAFAVPATTNRKYLERLRARLVATDQRTNPSELQNVMATKPLAAPYVDQADIASALTTAQEGLRQDDRTGALEVLRAMIAEVEKPSARRLIPLSKERAAIERVEFDRG